MICVCVCVCVCISTLMYQPTHQCGIDNVMHHASDVHHILCANFRENCKSESEA